MTKKLTRIDAQSTWRIDVMRDSYNTPAMSKRKTSPSFKPKVLANNSSTLMALGSSGCHSPEMMGLLSGNVSPKVKLNSRSTKRLARSSE